MPCPVLIMAGGKGLRLHPLTLKAPKPMLPIGTKPILQTIIERFVAQGFTEVILATGYKAELIEGYFGDGSRFGATITYLREDEAQPLDTGGALWHAAWAGPIIVSNADVLATLDYEDLLRSHSGAGSLATVCAALYQHQVHYGVLEVSPERRLTGMREKPIECLPVNAGVYVVEREALRYADPPPFSMPELLSRLPAGSVNVYPLQDIWIDIGRFEDLTRAHVNAVLAGQ